MTRMKIFWKFDTKRCFFFCGDLCGDGELYESDSFGTTCFDSGFYIYIYIYKICGPLGF